MKNSGDITTARKHGMAGKRKNTYAHYRTLLYFSESIVSATNLQSGGRGTDQLANISFWRYNNLALIRIRIRKLTVLYDLSKKA